MIGDALQVLHGCTSSATCCTLHTILRGFRDSAFVCFTASLASVAHYPKQPSLAVFIGHMCNQDVDMTSKISPALFMRAWRPVLRTCCLITSAADITLLTSCKSQATPVAAAPSAHSDCSLRTDADACSEGRLRHSTLPPVRTTARAASIPIPELVPVIAITLPLCDGRASTNTS